ncbi:MAG: hypothetical protein ACRCVJ_12025 [Clostridium sp.]|uniref:hypothetical protein n=1 Tax=Clostridium sp. TaxID=1506 RepID=UPI003F4027B0
MISAKELRELDKKEMELQDKTIQERVDNELSVIEKCINSTRLHHIKKGEIITEIKITLDLHVRTVKELQKLGYIVTFGDDKYVISWKDKTVKREVRDAYEPKKEVSRPFTRQFVPIEMDVKDKENKEVGSLEELLNVLREI